jgi:hypothetical protein
MYKGAVRVTTKRDKKLEQVTGRGCGRPTNSEGAALELAENAARRMLGV